MDIDSIRRYCLSFRQAKENLQWQDDLCFKVGGKIFALIDLHSVPPHVCFKCTPDRFAELLERDGIVAAPYVGRYKWVLLKRLNVLPASELKDLIRQSYEMVAAKMKVGKAKKRGPR